MRKLKDIGQRGETGKALPDIEMGSERHMFVFKPKGEENPLRVTLQLHRETGKAPPYVETGGEKTLFVFKLQGYENAFRAMFETLGKSIDEEAEPSRIDATERAFFREDAAFKRLLPQLLQDCPGVFVAVHKGRVIDKDANDFALARRIDETHRSEFVLIRRVSGEVFDDHLPSPEVEMP